MIPFLKLAEEMSDSIQCYASLPPAIIAYFSICRDTFEVIRWDEKVNASIWKGALADLITQLLKSAGRSLADWNKIIRVVQPKKENEILLVLVGRDTLKGLALDFREETH